jgi:membrane protease YdiL (CAAX protease family)
MVVLIELIALILFLLFTRKNVRKVIFINPRSLTLGIFFGLVYSLIVYFSKQTDLGKSIAIQFIQTIGLQSTLLYIIYPPIIAISEEFIFRYFIPDKFGVFLTACFFAILHWRPNFPILLLPSIFLFALSQSWLLNKTKTIIPLIIVHLFVTYSLLLL